MKNFRVGCLIAGILLTGVNLVAGEYDADIKRHQGIIAKDPTNLDATYQLGNILAWDSRYEEALKVYEGILMKEPKYQDAEIGIARVYGWKGDQKKAAEKYQEIIAKDPKVFEAYQGLGNLALWTNDFEKSVHHFKKALAINPEDIVSLKGIGRAYLGRGDRRQAEEAFTKAQILEIKKTPLPVIIGITGGSLFILLILVFVIRLRIRKKRSEFLRMELKVLRYALALYHQRTGKFPLALENLLQEKWRLPADTEDRPYLDGIRHDDRGFLVDSFGKRYWYNPDTGGIYSTTRGCEKW